MQEAQAIAELLGGNIRGLEVLVREYSQRAQQVAYFVTRDRDLAEDAVQDAFVRVCDRIASYDATRPFAPWFLRIVANTAIDAAARRDRHRGTPNSSEDQIRSILESLPDHGVGPEVSLERSELRNRVWDALGELPPKQRAAILMRYYLDMSEVEIAHQLEIPQGTVKSRLHTARVRLKTLLPVFRQEVN